MDLTILDGITIHSYVVHGATLQCSHGSLINELQLPIGHGVFIKWKKQANTSDYKSMYNILSFGLCSVIRAPCIPAVMMNWLNGKEDVIIEEDTALLNTSIAICSCGGIISIIDDGQLK